MSLTESEWIEEVRNALTTENPDGFYTVQEIAKLLDASLGLTRSKLAAIRDADRLECTFVERKSISGVRVRVPAYRILPA